MTVAEEFLTRTPLIYNDLEHQIGDLVQLNRRNTPVPKTTSSMPNYVEHREGVNQVGKLSAEAVVREYDATVKEIEALGEELKDAARKCEAMVAGVHTMVAEIKELASSYRDEGKRYFLQIEDCSLMTTEVRTVCENLKQKIAAHTVS